MIKHGIYSILLALLWVSCSYKSHKSGSPVNEWDYYTNDSIISQSLFNDRQATISEENIQKILNGSYKLPEKVRIAVIKLDGNEDRRYYWNDENYLKNQQAYIDLFTEKLKQSPRVTSVNLIPDILMSKKPSFTGIREAAVRMQADVVLVYSITSDIYTKYRAFSKTDVKAFATTQIVILDVRTGLIPFSSISTKESVSQKKTGELETSEVINRVKKEAVTFTIQEITQKLSDFLKN